MQPRGKSSRPPACRPLGGWLVGLCLRQVYQQRQRCTVPKPKHTASFLAVSAFYITLSSIKPHCFSIDLSMTVAISLILGFAAVIYASPIARRQAVTELISPSSPPPPGCTGSFPSAFGIAVMNISLPSSSSSPSQTLQRRQQPPSPIFTVGTVDEIDDGQIQGGMHTVPISIETPTPLVATLPPVTQIGDGQIQGPVATDGPTGPTSTDTICENSSSPFPPLPAPAAISKPPTVIEQACGISTRPTSSAPTPAPIPSPTFANLAAAVSAAFSNLNATRSTTPTTSSSPTSSTTTTTTAEAEARLSLVSCLTNSTLQLHLQDSNLFDGLNRTGYIASNYQFQFDGPPQSGAIYTSGWSLCPVPDSTTPHQAGDEDDDDDGLLDGVMTLALGESTIFWQCLSGNFYNLYTENWAAQCSPVELRITRLVDCD
ncbi:hypothetical protein PV04_08626 [Phialophora macrospora]|uniref:Cell wall mannoprotein PIR1-like C-terminal domain-containing protein n=1 Tax=Phialophora macrospora TaxID=1851006 RepID=A0A0D2CEV6_9EURO|nr:hypothetical protein PV04_08626 [Phialophora macrospora]